MGFYAKATFKSLRQNQNCRKLSSSEKGTVENCFSDDTYVNPVDNFVLPNNEEELLEMDVARSNYAFNSGAAILMMVFQVLPITQNPFEACYFFLLFGVSTKSPSNLWNKTYESLEKTMDMSG